MNDQMEEASDDCYDSQSVLFEMDDGVCLINDNITYDREVMEKTVVELEQSLGSLDGSNLLEHDIISYASDVSESWSSDDESNICSNEISDTLDDDLLHMDVPTTDGVTLRYLYGDFSFMRHGHSEYRDNSQLYFFEKYRAKAIEGNDGTGGYRSLCYRATRGIRYITDASNLEEFRIAKLLFRMNSALLRAQGSTTTDVMELVETLCDELQHRIDEKLGKDTFAIVPHNLPRTYADARRILLDGRNSVMENFPAPKVFVIGHHACVSLKESIQHLAGHRGKFEFTWNGKTRTRNRDGLNGTAAAGRIVVDVMDCVTQNNGDETTSVGIFSLWSDSYLQSFIKQKDNSVWLLTANIGLSKEDISKGTYTVVLAIGRKSQDHTEVIDHYMNEVQELKKGFDCYLACTNSIERVAFGLLYWSTDRPERQYVLNTLGEGTFGKITGYAAQICTTKLPACRECYLHIVDNVNNSRCKKRRCGRCHGWNIDPNDPNQEVNPVPEGYPGPTILLDEEGLTIDPPVGREPGRRVLGPIKLSSSWIINACSFAYEARRRNRWNKKEFHTFLRCCCVCESRRNIIENQAILDSRNNTCSTQEKYLPNIWLSRDPFDMFLFCDMPMHAMAYGMGDDYMQFLHTVLTEFKQGTAYGDFANEIISEIEAFNLDWCKPKSYPKSAWVGENVMAYLRLSSYLYGMFMVTKPFFGEYEALMITVKKMINAFQAMLSILMSTNPQIYQQYDLLREHIKLCLSTAHYCQLEFEPTSSDNRTTSRKKDSPVDDLTNREIGYLLYKLEIEHGSNPRNCLEKINVKSLCGYLHAMGVPTQGKKKSDLQVLLFEALLEREINWQDQHLGQSRSLRADNSGTDIRSDPNFIWNKGAWLSFVTNISEQIKFLGPLTWIW